MSNARYQRSRQGRRLHAARQARYRGLRSKVTDQGSGEVVTGPMVTQATEEAANARHADRPTIDFAPVCCLCRVAVAPNRGRTRSPPRW